MILGVDTDAAHLPSHPFIREGLGPSRIHLELRRANLPPNGARGSEATTRLRQSKTLLRKLISPFISPPVGPTTRLEIGASDPEL